MNPLTVRWLYPALLGLALIVGGVLHHLEPRWSRASRLLTVSVVVLCAGLNWQAQSLWRDEAIVIERTFQCAPRSPLATFQYAALLREMGRVSEAEQITNQLIREQPEHPTVLSRQIDALIRRNDYEQAFILAQRLVVIRPSFIALRQLADLERATGRIDSAMIHYRQALASHQGDPLTMTTLGSLYEQRRQWRDAAELYHQGLTLYPTAANLWFRYGRVLEAEGRLQEAEDAYKQVVTWDRFCPDGSLAVARLQEQRGALSEAEATRQRYATLTHQPLHSRPVSDETDAPCGMELKASSHRPGVQTPSTFP